MADWSVNRLNSGFRLNCRGVKSPPSDLENFSGGDFFFTFPKKTQSKKPDHVSGTINVSR